MKIRLELEHKELYDLYEEIRFIRNDKIYPIKSKILSLLEEHKKIKTVQKSINTLF